MRTSSKRRTGRSSAARRRRIATKGPPTRSGEGREAAGDRAREGSARPKQARTCVACRRVRPKRELVRVVRSPAGELAVDLRGKASGRGAYVCPDTDCVERGIAEIARSLETTIPPQVAERLKNEMEDARKVRTANA